MLHFLSFSKRVTHKRNRVRSKTRRRPQPPRLLLERLEDRNLLSIFTVTNTLDDGSVGSLRWAINQTNADADPLSNINFNIPGSGVQTIAPTSALPTITHPVIIDGYTQPGSSPNTLGIGPGSPGHSLGDGDNAVLKIELSGANAGLASGLTSISDNNVVRGLVINRFEGAAIALQPGQFDESKNDIIAGNFIGTDATGTIALPNSTAPFQVSNVGAAALYIASRGNEIGGLQPADRNLISGNFANGIFVANYQNRNDQIQGNLIGTDATGTLRLGNGSQGIEAGEGTIVGGSSPAARNIVAANKGTFYDNSGSYGDGVLMYGANVVVQGNFVGTDVGGTQPLSNAGAGIKSGGFAGDLIGGTNPGEGNLISANTYGINVRGALTIQGNLIGTDWTGTVALGNHVGITWGGGGASFANSNIFIGGTTSGAGNVISGNSVGVDILAPGVTMQGNVLGYDKTGTVGIDEDSRISCCNGPTITLRGGASGTVVGGSTSGAGNLIGDGIQLSGASVTGNFIEGNFINNGVGVDSGASNNMIGGTAPGAGNKIVAGGTAVGLDQGTGNSIVGNSIFNSETGVVVNASGNTISNNVISGNGTPLGPNNASGFGVILYGNGNVVSGNLIGADPSGQTSTRGNANGGVTMLGGQGNTISGNIVSGNGDDSADSGIDISRSGSSGNSVLNNVITHNSGYGITIAALNSNNNLVAGNSIQSNGGNGVLILGGASNNTIGGTATGAGNIIAFNGATGVDVDSGTGNSIIGNSIHDNGPVSGIPGGIYLNSANNANNNQAAPILTAASGSSSGTTTSGTLQSVASTTFRLEFFSNQSPDPTRFGQGQTFLGYTNVTTDGSGKASFTATGLAPVPAGQGYVSSTATVIRPDLTFSDTSQFSNDINYTFSGFLAPINKNIAFALNRTIPIKFQLFDLQGTAVTSPSAVTSLQIQALDSNGNPVGSPFNPTSAGNTGLVVSGTTYVFNWQTKGLSAGSYEILLTLADRTLHTKVLQLNVSGTGSATQMATGTDGGDKAGLPDTVLGGDLLVYINDPSGYFTPDELARIQDTINALDALLAPYGVAITVVTDSTIANLVLDNGATSACGGMAQAVLGCFNPAGEITILQGWNWYAGADPTLIGPNQYDFQSTVTHEFGHALGLGGDPDPNSPMYEILGAGQIHRTFTLQDLNFPDNPAGPDPEMALLPWTGVYFSDASRLLFGGLYPPPQPFPTRGEGEGAERALSGSQSPLNAVLADWSSDTDFADRASQLLGDGPSKIHLYRAGALTIDDQDDFWSTIGGTMASDRIIDLNGEIN